VSLEVLHRSEVHNIQSNVDIMRSWICAIENLCLCCCTGKIWYVPNS